MKATAMALVFVGGYWIIEGYKSMGQEGSYGIWLIALGIGILPFAKFLWDREIGPKKP